MYDKQAVKQTKKSRMKLAHVKMNLPDDPILAFADGDGRFDLRCFDVSTSNPEIQSINVTFASFSPWRTFCPSETLL